MDQLGWAGYRVSSLISHDKTAPREVAHFDIPISAVILSVQITDER
jgi:hypothetical protein